MTSTISDDFTYLRGLWNTFQDKAWFMSLIPDDVEYILDFGCADGKFMEYMQRRWREYTYIGVDANKEFRLLAQARGFDCFKDLDQAVSTLLISEYYQKPVAKIDPSKTLVVMNSVLHEVYS